MLATLFYCTRFDNSKSLFLVILNCDLLELGRSLWCREFELPLSPFSKRVKGYFNISTKKKLSEASDLFFLLEKRELCMFHVKNLQSFQSTHALGKRRGGEGGKLHTYTFLDFSFTDFMYRIYIIWKLSTFFFTFQK